MAYYSGGGGVHQSFQYPGSATHKSLNPKDAKSRVDDIVRILQHYMEANCGLRASEVVKGGSLGQGTAIPGDFDLDLLVYSRDISNKDMLNSRKLESHLMKIYELLRVKLQITDASLTEHGLQFKYDELAVDLLPSPYFSTAKELHDVLNDFSLIERRMFSCSAAKWFKEFLSQQPDQAKEFIRRAKSWRNNKWPSKQNGDGRPKSILISLLVIEAYGRSVSKGGQSVTDLMKNDVRGHARLRIHWTYNGALYDRKFASEFPQREPYIIDPSNPFNNVYKSGIGYYKANSPEGTYYQGDGNWSNFVHYIDSLDLTKENGTRY